MVSVSEIMKSYFFSCSSSKCFVPILGGFQSSKDMMRAEQGGGDVKCVVGCL